MSCPARPTKKGEPAGAPWIEPEIGSGSVEPSGRVRQHGVDLAGFRGEIAACHHLAAVVARDLFEQPLELADVAVDGLLELAVATIALADLVERLLALHGVEPLVEGVALAAIV